MVVVYATLLKDIMAFWHRLMQPNSVGFFMNMDGKLQHGFHWEVLGLGCPEAFYLYIHIPPLVLPNITTVLQEFVLSCDLYKKSFFAGESQYLHKLIAIQVSRF